MKIALIGCGAIAKVIAQAIKNKKVNVELKYVYGRNTEKAKKFAERFHTEYKSFDQILNEDLDVIVEAASQEAVRTLIPKILKTKKNVIIMSSGALVDKSLLQEIRDLAKKNNLKVYIPSGALVGLDGIKSASIEEVKRVTLKTRKSPKSLEGAPFFIKNPVDFDNIEKPRIIYEGSAKEAVKLFPARLNIASSLSLAGIGPEKTIVQIIVDPNVESNVHEIIAEGSFGTIIARTENIPSYNMAALSAVATLKKITKRIQVGT